MRVLVVASSPPWPMTDGAGLVLNHQLRHLAHRHEITVVAAGRPAGAEAPDRGPLGLPDDLPISWFGEPAGRFRTYGHRRWAGLRSGEPDLVHAVETADVVATVDAMLDAADSRPDLVHLHGWGTARLAGRTELPVVHMAIDAWQRGVGEQRSLPRWRRLLEAGQRAKVVRHEATHYPRCDAVVVVAPADAAALRSAAPRARIEVLANGVDAGPPAGGPADGPVLGFHGVLSTVANETAARAVVDDVLPRVRRRHPAATALLIGRDPGPALLRLRSPTVEVTGEVDDLRTALGRIGVYVAPLTRGSGIKNKVLEAMAAGLPVVATTRAVDGIDAADALVVAPDVAGVADAAGDLLDDRDRARRLGARARDRVETMTWVANATALEALWIDVVEGR